MSKHLLFPLMLVAFVMGMATTAQATTMASDLWLFDWEIGYVDLDSSNANTSGWSFPDTSSNSITVGGNCADSGNNSGANGELSMTLSGLTPGTSYSIDAVVASDDNDDVGDYSVLAGFTSGAANQTAYNNYQLNGVNKGRDVAYANRAETGYYLVRLPLGSQEADANGQITVYFNEDVSHTNPWQSAGGRAMIDGLVYAETAAIPTIPGKLILSADRSGGTTYDNDDSPGGRPFIGIHDGETDPLEASFYGLRLGATTFSDRTFCVDGLSDELVGADYVRTFLGDKGDSEADFSYDITLSQDVERVFLMVLVDDRLVSDDGYVLQEIVDGVVADFAAAGEFVDTGWDIDANDSGTAHPLSAFGAWVPTKDVLGDPITYAMGATPSGATSTYMIAAMVPEPSTYVLLIGAAMLLLPWRRRS
ncbi:MAG: PEP-CTERM sorting domain-containing protein [Pirellulales bacterium]|nr:PEP-CTERM sorting domain-containing protein [Pirellulales bacterium]